MLYFFINILFYSLCIVLPDFLENIYSFCWNSAVFSCVLKFWPVSSSSLVARWYRICLQCRRPWFNPRVGKIPWRREWLPVAIFLPGEFHGQRSLVCYSPWDHRVKHGWATNTHGNPIKPWLSVHLFKEDWHLSPELVMSQGQQFIYFKKYYLFICLHPVFVLAYGSFFKLRYMGSSSLTRDQTQASYIRRMECKPRDHHGSPRKTVYFTSQFDGVPDLSGLGAVQNPYRLVSVLLRLQLRWADCELSLQEGLLAPAVAALAGCRDTRGDVPVLVAAIHCDERMQRKVRQGESTWSEVPGNQAPTPRASSWGGTQEVLNSPRP